MDTPGASINVYETTTSAATHDSDTSTEPAPPAVHSAQHTSQAAAAIVQNGINAVTLHVYMQHTPVQIS